MKKVLSYKIMYSFYALVCIQAKENVYEYDDLKLKENPVYSQTTSLTNSRRSSRSLPDNPPRVQPRPAHTLTAQSQPISSRTSTNDTMSDSFSFDPSDSTIDNSRLLSVLDDAIYTSIPGEENLYASKKRNPKKDPLPALPDTLSSDDRLYERVSQVVPETPFKRKPALRIKAKFFPRRPIVMPKSKSQFEEFDNIQFIRD